MVRFVYFFSYPPSLAATFSLTAGPKDKVKVEGESPEAG
jgi:hypothetical protein